MRFQKQIRLTRSEPSGRRIAAAKKAVAREADAMALYPELRRDTDPIQRIERIDRSQDAYVQRLRDYDAGVWRRARYLYRALPADARALIDWDNPRAVVPAKGHYLATRVYQEARRMAEDHPQRICCGAIMGYIPAIGWYCPACQKEEK
jgi:hypothetical protein